MSRITQAFEKRKSRGVLVAYITGGDPTLEVTEALVPVLASAGADVVELGMPFSDPLLDG
ncbi:MAG: tryptophan synthase subunit alpha, partial [Armatimonadetes bacterium]|nr:tryptophan synthase subunit alpha [Armatimonadota bacterium]